MEHWQTQLLTGHSHTVCAQLKKTFRTFSTPLPEWGTWQSPLNKSCYEHPARQSINSILCLWGLLSVGSRATHKAHVGKAQPCPHPSKQTPGAHKHCQGATGTSWAGELWTGRTECDRAVPSSAGTLHHQHHTCSPLRAQGHCPSLCRESCSPRAGTASLGAGHCSRCSSVTASLTC